MAREGSLGAMPQLGLELSREKLYKLPGAKTLQKRWLMDKNDTRIVYYAIVAIVAVVAVFFMILLANAGS
jgi:hypothetical protein